jgi:flagellar biosynthesis protein FlhA
MSMATPAPAKTPSATGSKGRGRPELSNYAVPLLMVGIIGMMVLPLPPLLLDVLLAANLSAAVLVLLTAMMADRALDFSVFPSLLLVTTLARLALNVSSTRLILLHGSAGNVIAAFGHFVVGGNIVVGLVVFLILVVIQFTVITSGAGRVAEVAARFTLDAMPGKQMAIDADLNSGLCTEDEARRRRREVAREADFYGAMDGASKFVKGDAIAAVVIVAINLFGGFIIGVVQQHLTVQEAISRFSLLSVGDGLVSQIPALLISVASGIVVTRVDTDDDGGLGGDIARQLTRSRRALQIAGGAIVVLGLLPGLPKLPFLVMGGVLLLVSSRVSSPAPVAAVAPEATVVDPDSTEGLLSDLAVEPLELALAPDLLDLLSGDGGPGLIDRVRALRRRVATDTGVVLPPVRSRDEMELPPSVYVVRLHGVEVARGEAPSGYAMVLGEVGRGLPGRPTVDPVFGLPATWVGVDLADLVAADGATVIDRGSVIVTHLSEVVRRHARELLSRQDVSMLVEAVKRDAPALGEDIGEGGLALTQIHRILGDLLDERAPIRDLRRILEAVTSRSRDSKQHEHLVEAARGAVGPAIAASLLGPNGSLATLTFEPVLEQMLLESVRQGDAGSWLAIAPAQMEEILTAIGAAVKSAESAGNRPVIVCSGQIRPAVRRLVAAGRTDLAVLSYTEVGNSVKVEAAGVISRGPSMVVAV